LAKDLLRTTKDLFASATSGSIVATCLSILEDSLLDAAEPEAVASMDRWTPAAAGCTTFAPRLLVATAVRRLRRAELLDAKPVSLHVEAGARRLGAG
jgi:hypothetical protein